MVFLYKAIVSLFRYQDLRFVERGPVTRTANNDYPESPYESLQRDDRTDSFDQQFSYRYILRYFCFEQFKIFIVHNPQVC